MWSGHIHIVTFPQYLYIASDEHVLSPPDLHEFININKINMVTTTPAFLAQMPQIVIKSLNTLVVMGDMAYAKYHKFLV